jgi:hypothetical protein
MDKDEFQAWKDSPATRWALSRLQEAAQRVEQGLKDRLYLSTGLPPEQWASLQAQAAYDRGYVAAIGELVDLKAEDVGIEQ